MQIDANPAPAPATPADPASNPALAASAGMEGRPRRHRWLLLALLLVVIGWAIVCFDWNLFKGMVERRVTAATGRAFHIDGDLDVDLSMNPLITMDGLRLGNIPGAKEPTMASAQQLRMRIKLWPLLHGETILPELHLVRPVVLLEKDASGADNWSFPASTANPTIQQFTIDHGVLTYRETAKGTNLVIGLNSDKPDAASRLAPVLLQGKGTLKNNPFALQGRVDSPLALADAEKPYRIDISANAGPTKAHASGALRHPLQVTGFNLDFSLAGPDLALLYPLLGVATPETPPYRLRGQLGHINHIWTYNKFSGMVGDSDLAGNLTIDATGKKSALKAELLSRRLDFDDLGGFIGAPPKTGRGETASAKQIVESAKLQASARVLPDHPYDLERLRGMDADVTLRAQHLNAPKLPLESMLAHMYIKDGVLRLDPLNFDAAGGRIESQIRMDASRQQIASTAKIKLRKLDLGKLLPNAKLTRTSFGLIGADANLKGTGNSVAKMLATSDGHIHMGMGEGEISHLLMAYAALDLGDILLIKIKGDHDVKIRCAIGDFTARQGIWSTNTFVFDTSDATVRGSGNMDLGEEQLDLLLKVKPKHLSLLSLRSPLRVRGSFKHASVRPDFKALGIRGLAAIALGAIAPPAAELAFVGYNKSKDSDCIGGAAAE